MAYQKNDEFQQVAISALNSTFCVQYIMIKWKSTFGHSVELVFLGYQFPKIDKGHDANWLEIKIDARNEIHSWTKTSACLFTWDVLRLQYWLTEVVERESEYDSFIVMDYDLEIKYIATSLRKHVFAIVLRSGLSISDADCDVIFVSISDSELLNAVKYLESIFLSFPPRGEIGKKSLERIKRAEVE